MRDEPTDPPYAMVLSPGARRALTDTLPAAAACAAREFISRPLAAAPRVVGTPLRSPLCRPPPRRLPDLIDVSSYSGPGPTVLIEVAGWRLLTDPTFDPAGGHYAFGWGTSSDKVTGPALDVDDLPPVDAVLLTHDHHGDNLDTAGRHLLSSVGTVLTTVAGARRLTGIDVRGLAAGEVTRLTAPGRPDLEVTATPARHGPPLSRPIVGDVVGFAVRGTGDSRVLVWVTGDTVLYDGLREAAKDVSVDVLVVHVGGVQFPITGPLRYTMTGPHAVELVDLVGPRVAVPVHYEGWSHFKDGRAGIERALAKAPEATRSRVRWLEPGSPTDLS